MDHNLDAFDRKTIIDGEEEAMATIAECIKSICEEWGAENLGHLAHRIYKDTACGAGIGVEFLRSEVGVNGTDLPDIRNVTDNVYAEDIAQHIRKYPDALPISISVSSIVEGVDYDTETHIVKLTGTEPEDAVRTFNLAVEAVEREAASIWNDTHGCDGCAKHWKRQGIDTEVGDCPVWDKCRTCKGHGIII